MTDDALAKSAKPDSQIPPVERYKFVTSQIRFYTERMRDSFKLYVQIATATLAGYAWLKLPEHVASSERITQLIPGFFFFISAYIAAQIALDHYFWFGYRRAEAQLLGEPKLMPRFPQSAWGTVLVVFGILASGVAGLMLFFTQT